MIMNNYYNELRLRIFGRIWDWGYWWGWAEWFRYRKVKVQSLGGTRQDTNGSWLYIVQEGTNKSIYCEC